WRSLLSCRKATLADIVFLVDTSTGIGQENFQKVKDFLSTLVSSLDVGLDAIRVGLAQYSDETYQVFLLNQYSLKSDVLKQIEDLPYRRGETYTGTALDFVSAVYFTESAGSRAKDYIPQVAILITNGESNDEVEGPARKLREEGISVYVVAIGVHNKTELQQIASKPFSKFLYSIGNFDDLQDLSTRLLGNFCFAIESRIEGKKLSLYWCCFSCLYCAIMKIRCRKVILILTWFTRQSFHHVTPLKTMGLILSIPFCNSFITFFPLSAAFAKQYADVIFLIDSTENMTPSTFEEVKRFISQTVSQLDVGLNKYSIGLVQFSGIGQVEFLLNTYENKEEVLDHIRHSGGTRTGDALRSMKSLFRMAVRQNVPQTLIVITDGKSQDKVNQAAKELRQQEIVIYAIGIKEAVREELAEIEDGINLVAVGVSTTSRAELQEIIGDQERFFFAQSYDSLESIHKNLMQIVCEKSQPGKGDF
uniref:VWFA domain-containing protein n=1 Tax=Apteryx owenii TaxID=8824 RepID=A0A8B9SDP0_APTOW